MVASVPGAIAAAVLVPLLIITICLVLFYLWKQKKDKKDIGTGPEVSYIFFKCSWHPCFTVELHISLCVYFKTFVSDCLSFFFSYRQNS